MRKRSKLVSMLLVALLLSSLLLAGACGPAEQEGVTEIEILAVESGLAGYFLSFGLGDIINQYSTDLHATTLETVSATNVRTLASYDPERQKRTIIWHTPTGNYLAKQGIPPTAPDTGPYMDCKLLAHLLDTGDGLITLDPNIKSPLDLVGKRVGVGVEGNSATYHIQWPIEFGYEIPLDQIEWVYSSAGGAKSALLDGQIDAAFAPRLVGGPGEEKDWIPAPTTEEILSTKKAYFVNYDPAVYPKVRALGYPVYPLKGKVKQVGQSDAQGWVATAQSLCWYVHKDMPDELVTELLTLIWDHVDLFVDYHATGRFMNQEGLAQALSARDEYHPAAIKFFEDKGIKVGQD